jgi:hypothetical protein
MIVIRDRFAGRDAETDNIFSLNLMAEGTVDTPAGTISPRLRSFQHDNDLPSAGKVLRLEPGLRRFRFTGQWLIDWDLYTVSSSSQEAQVGNWAHAWHPTREQAEFAQANGREFEERQHILRIKGTGPFQTLILPYRKGQKRNDLQVKQEETKVTMVTKDEITTIADSFYAYKNSQRRVLAIFDDRSSTEANDISAAGGPVEIIVEPQRVTITAHGKKGMRKIRLPGAWSVKDRKLDVALTFDGGTWLLDYQHESPVTVTLER